MAGKLEATHSGVKINFCELAFTLQVKFNLNFLIKSVLLGFLLNTRFSLRCKNKFL